MKAALVSISLICLLLSNSLFAQVTHSIQFNGGLIIPMNSSKGLSGSVQYNYHLTPTVQFFINTGYSAWDQFKITLYVNEEKNSTLQRQHFFSSYSATDHELISVYTGSRINFRTTKWFTSFVNLEFGYSKLTYNENENYIERDPDTDVVLGFYAVGPVTQVKEDLYGFAVGVGFSHTISQNINLMLTYRFHSFLNMEGQSFLGTRSTSSTVLASCEFNI